MSDKRTTIIETRKEYFQQLWKDWWTEGGKLNLLHEFNKFLGSFMRHELIRKGYLSERDGDPLRTVKILDVGCGGGFLSEILAKMGCEVTGIDVTPNLVEVAKNHASCDPLTSKTIYITEPIEHHAECNAEKYDVVVSIFVIEQVNDKEYFLSSCMECVKPGGLFFVAAVNKTFLSWLVIINIYKRICKYVHDGMLDWNKFTTPQYVLEIIEKNNFEIIDTRGYMYNVFTGNLTWIPTWGVFYIIEARKRQ